MNAISTVAVAEIVEDVLDEMGLPWKRRESGWVIPAGAHRPREVTLTPSPEGLHVEAELCSWDTLGESERQALTLVLDRASSSLSPARGLVGEMRATVTATMEIQAIETGLQGAVRSVLVGSRALAREATALLMPGLASEVLRFFLAEMERNLATERI